MMTRGVSKLISGRNVRDWWFPEAPETHGSATDIIDCPSKQINKVHLHINNKYIIIKIKMEWLCRLIFFTTSQKQPWYFVINGSSCRERTFHRNAFSRLVRASWYERASIKRQQEASTDVGLENIPLTMMKYRILPQIIPCSQISPLPFLVHIQDTGRMLAMKHPPLFDNSTDACRHGEYATTNHIPVWHRSYI